MSEKITRPTLAKYAAMLGRGSIAATALAVYDWHKNLGEHQEIHLKNNGFIVYRVVDGQKIARHFG